MTGKDEMTTPKHFFTVSKPDGMSRFFWMQKKVFLNMTTSSLTPQGTGHRNYGLPLDRFTALHGYGSLIEKKRFFLTVPDENNMFSTI